MKVSTILRQTISAFEFSLIKIIQFWLHFFSYQRISDTGALAGSLFGKIGIRKQTAMENVLRSNLKMNSAHAMQIVIESYRHFGRTFFELLAMDRIQLRKDHDYALVLPDRFYEQIADGGVFISAHVGNWELMGKVLVEQKVPMAVVVKRQQNARIDKLISRQRENAGMVVVYEDEIVQLRRLIERKYCIALLSDQDFGDNTVPVNFLGRPCFAPEGPVFFAKKFRIPIFMCFAIRQGNFFHRFEIRPFEYNMSLANEILVQSYTNEIEEVVSAHPAQWLWHHRRWKVHA